MSTTPVPIAYTNRDFWSIQEALKHYIQQKFPDTWRDWYASSTGQILLDVIAASFDVLSFQLDYTANEMFLDTARDRRSVLLLGRLMGYKMATARSASVACTASLESTYTQNIVIPAGTAVKTVSGLDFYTVLDQTILAGHQTGRVVLVQGVQGQETFVSDGSAFQKLSLVNSGVVQDTVQVTVAGTLWSPVDSLVYAESTGQNYAVEFDEKGACTVLFGNNTVGAVPSASASIVVSYRQGGGVQGNIPVGTVATQVQGQKEGVDPASFVSVSLQNDAEAGAGGEDAETITHAKLWIPRWVRSNNRAVTTQDYDTLANVFSDPVYGSPAFAKSGLKQSIPELNTVLLAVWSRDSQSNIVSASSGLKQALSDYFNNDGTGAVKMVCTRTEVVDGAIVYVDLTGELGVQSSFSRNSVLADVNKALSAMFLAETGPGEAIRISRFYATNQAVTGVAYSIIRKISLSIKKEETIATGNGTADFFTGTVNLESGFEIAGQSLILSYGDTTDTVKDDGQGNLLNSVQEIVGSVDYDSGLCTFSFSRAPGADVAIVASYRYIFDYQRYGSIGSGNGIKKHFGGVLPFAPVVRQYCVGGVKIKGIAFTDGIQTVTDDGNGNLIGDVETASGTVNRIDYDSGAYEFTFASAVPSGADVNFAYRQLMKTAAQDLPIEPFQLWVKGTINLTGVSV